MSDAEFGFPLVLSNCLITDGINLERAHVRWASFDGSHVGGGQGNGPAMSLARLQSDHLVSLSNGFSATGEVDLTGARIGDGLYCKGGRFNNPNARALTADGIAVSGGVYLSDSCVVLGSVRLLGASIHGSLECDRGRFVNRGGAAINANRATTDGSVFFRDGVELDGYVIFAAATVKAFFHWHNIHQAELSKLDLTSAHIGTLWDDAQSWPDTMYLDGCVYDRIFARSPLDTRNRLRWLRRQHNAQFQPQPYQQLAGVMTSLGYDTEAREILVAMNEDPLRVGKLNIVGRVWQTVLGLTLGYGYMPWRAAWLLLGAALLGTASFAYAWSRGHLMPATKEPVPGFNPLVYAIDTLLPIIDLDQGKHWRPETSLWRGVWWFYVASGWVLATFLVAGMSGFIRS